MMKVGEKNSAMSLLPFELYFKQQGLWFCGTKLKLQGLRFVV